MNLRLFSVTWQKQHFTNNSCGNEEYSLNINMNAKMGSGLYSDGLLLRQPITPRAHNFESAYLALPGRGRFICLPYIYTGGQKFGILKLISLSLKNE